MKITIRRKKIELLKTNNIREKSIEEGFEGKLSNNEYEIQVMLIDRVKSVLM